MSDIHPHWHAIDQEEPEASGASVRVSSPNATRIPIGLSHVSRQPAAVVGILVVIGISFLLIRGAQEGTEQLRGSVEVLITQNGLEPATVTVQQGQEITWINQQDMPHILESRTLCSAADDCLYTRTLFQNDRYTFTVSAGMEPGTYTYSSSTSEDIAGQIIVTKRQEEVPAKVAASTWGNLLAQTPQQETMDMENPEDVPFNDSFPNPETFGNPVDNPEPLGNPNPAILPRNPYTAGSDRIGPSVDFGNEPAPEFFEGGGPMRQPETGMSIWLVAMGSLLGIYGVTRRCFRQSTHL